MIKRPTQLDEWISSAQYGDKTRVPNSIWVNDYHDDPSICIFHDGQGSLEVHRISKKAYDKIWSDRHDDA